MINNAIYSSIFYAKKLNQVYKYQSLLNWSDYNSTTAWTKQAAISTAGGKAFAHSFRSLSINSGLQCTSTYINTKNNIIADDLSQIKFVSLANIIANCLQVHVELKS